MRRWRAVPCLCCFLLAADIRRHDAAAIVYAAYGAMLACRRAMPPRLLLMRRQPDAALSLPLTPLYIKMDEENRRHWRRMLFYPCPEVTSFSPFFFPPRRCR